MKRDFLLVQLALKLSEIIFNIHWRKSSLESDVTLVEQNIRGQKLSLSLFTIFSTHFSFFWPCSSRVRSHRHIFSRSAEIGQSWRTVVMGTAENVQFQPRVFQPCKELLNSAGSTDSALSAGFAGSESCKTKNQSLEFRFVVSVVLLSIEYLSTPCQ